MSYEGGPNHEQYEGGESQNLVYSSSILFEKQPIEAMEALIIRRQQAKIINKELAEWLTSYGRLRLDYVSQLKKIHKKGQELFTSSSPYESELQNSKIDSLGLCSPMWHDILNVVNDEIKLFDLSTRKMGKDMIAPLRLFARNNDSNLIEMDELVEIAKRLKTTGNGEDEWERRAPYFFEIFENYDHQRLLLLKDVFLRYQTDLNDVLDQFKKDNENGLQHALNFNVEDEITRFSQDAIKSSFPIENIKLNSTTDKSKAAVSTDGFTSTAAHSHASASDSINSPSKRHSKLTSRFHLKHHENGENTLPEQPPSVSKRLSSSTSMFSSKTLASNNTNSDHKKEKVKMRSKFGSIFKGKKKNGKGFTPPSAIAEPDSASINTATTSASSRAPITQSKIHSQQQQYPPKPAHAQKESVVSNLSQSQASHEQSSVQASYQGEQTQTPVKKSFEPTRIPYDENKPLPMPVAPVPEYKSEPSDQDILEDSANPEYEKKPVLKMQASTESSLYEPMRPTKRSDSLTSVPQMQSTSSLTTDLTNSAPVSGITNSTSIAPISRGMDNIPETEVIDPSYSTAGISNGTSSAPPPPLSRKHVANELQYQPQPISRQPHGSIPTPPSQRKSMLFETPSASAQQPLQTAPTGSNNDEGTTQTLSKNTTGGGGLTGGQILHPSMTTPGLNSSIVELFNAAYKDGAVIRSNVIGEVAFSFIPDSSSNNTLPSEISLKIGSKSESTELPNFMVNTMFLKQSSTVPGSFTINEPSQILSRTVGGLKYMLNNPVPPIVITPVWKHEENQSTVIISIKPTLELDSYIESESLTLTNVMVSVSINGAVVSTAATKPTGTLNKEKARVSWVLQHPLTFNSSHKEERLVARFMTNRLATEGESGVQIRFNISNEDGASRIDFLNSDLYIQSNSIKAVEDPFGDGPAAAIGNSEENWSDVPTMKSLVAGSYSGHGA